MMSLITGLWLTISAAQQQHDTNANTGRCKLATLKDRSHTYAAHCCAPLVKHEKRFYQCERPITHCKPVTLQDGRCRHLADLHAHQDPCSNESLFFPFSGYTKILCKRLLTAWNLITQILILLTRCFAAFRSLCSITVSSRGFSTNSFELRTSYN